MSGAGPRGRVPMRCGSPCVTQVRCASDNARSGDRNHETNIETLLSVCGYSGSRDGGHDARAAGMLIAEGQLWRIVTCHFTHWSLDHLIWDAIACVILAALCETTDRRSFLLCLIASTVLIPLFIGLLMPEVDAYRGLSGIDSALFVLAATTILRENVTTRRWGWVAAAGMVLCGFAAKIGFEYVTGQTLFVDSAAADMVPIPLAHVVGGLVGAGISGWSWISGSQSVGSRSAPHLSSATYRTSN